MKVGRTRRTRRMDLAVTNEMNPNDLEIRNERLDSAVAGRLIGELNAELSAMYPEEGATH